MLALNADDFGCDGGHNQAIAEAWCLGNITSASILTVAPKFDEAVALAKKHGIRVGLHVCLTCEAALTWDYRPLTGHSCLTLDGKGKRFPNVCFKLLPEYLPQIQEEISAQYEKLRATGLPINHVDTHMHCVPGYDSGLSTALDPIYDKYKIRFIDYRKGAISPKVAQNRIVAWKSIGGKWLEGKIKRFEKMVAITAASGARVVWVHCHMNKEMGRGNSRKEEYKLFTSGVVRELTEKHKVSLWDGS